MCKCNKCVDGSKYIPYGERTGAESVVYFTRDLSADGLKKIYDRVSDRLKGNVAIKLHTGEKNGPNIIPSSWVKTLVDDRLPEASIIETNTFYDGDRYTTEKHRETLKINGWTFCPVDIIDDKGTAMLPVKNGKWFKEMSVGEGMLKYDSMLALTHFKGHVMGGFGGSNKNIGIGCTDGKDGKRIIHSTCKTDNMWDICNEELMERITESTKASIDYFGENIAYINILRNMSVSCDCEGRGAEPVVTPNIGIIASVDILAVDQASVDLVYSLKDEDKKALVERMETRHGHRQTTYMKELGMGNDRYKLIDIDNGDTIITTKEAVKDVVPFAAE